MATLDDLLNPSAGDPDIPALRQFLGEQMTDTRAKVMHEAANIALWETLDEDDGTRATEVAKSKRTQTALLAKYNNLERRRKALPADQPVRAPATLKK